MALDKITILWADDEIELLKPQLKFLESKGYAVVTVTNGHDAVDTYASDPTIDVVFLDESMPGLTGLETLPRIKELNQRVPVVMITKNEAEHVMEDAIGSQISDYLIKPVNPNQILLTLKRLIDNKRLVRQKNTSEYQQEFRNIFMEISGHLDLNQWVDIYKKIISWELKLDESLSEPMSEILSNQKKEANAEFSKFVDKHYQKWVSAPAEERPLMSDSLLKRKVFPQIKEDIPTFLLLLDNLRYDQWKVIQPILEEQFRMVEEDYFVSILPTSTQYSRNAIFSGMMPSDIEKHYPQYWKGDAEEGSKNQFEAELLDLQIQRLIRRPIKHEYFKVLNTTHAKQLNDNIINYLNNDFTAIVYNFIDTLSHARTEMEMLKELAKDEKAYRSLTKSWFGNSPLWSALKKLEGSKFRLIVTTDHGTIRVNRPSKVIADRDTTTNLRYKVGRNLQYETKDVLDFRDPAKVGLPRPNVSSTYIFAKEDNFFLYPNNYNHYLNYYKDTFQHGGISLEEMLCPIVTLVSR
jgi:CheY-like chemotaxis protein